jgi:hypothetical protein
LSPVIRIGKTELRRERDSLDAAALVEGITIGFRDLT